MIPSVGTEVDTAEDRREGQPAAKPGGPSKSHSSIVILNSGFNLAGQLVPLIAAYVAIPILARSLGAERFGVLTLGWLFLGYFSLFDLGLGRAVTQAVAQRLNTPTENEIPQIMWSAMALMACLGVAGAVVSAAVSPLLVFRVLRVSAALRVETLRSFWVFSLAVPLVVVTAGFRGVLEAKHRFDLVNALRAPLGIAMYLAPLAVLPFTHSLLAVAWMLLGVRLLACAGHAYYAARVVPAGGTQFQLRKEYVAPLLRLGGWMTVTNIVGPVLVSLDRFLIGAVLSVSAVAYYAAPYEAITKLWLFPAAITGVLFPTFAASGQVGATQSMRLYETTVKVVLIALFIPCVIAVAFSRELLRIWMGVAFAEHSATVLGLLAIGVLFNSLAMVPFALVQGRARADLTAKAHAAELPVYVVLLWFAIARFGVNGAALAWTIRCAVDAVVLFALAHRLLPMPSADSRRMLGALVAMLMALGALLMVDSFLARALLTGTVLVVGGVTLWNGLLSDEERTSSRSIVRRLGALRSTERVVSAEGTPN